MPSGPASPASPAARLRSNPLKQKLAEHGSVIGTFLEVPSPAVVEMMGLAGFDFVVVDGEHGPFDARTIEEFIRAGLSTEVSVIIRVAECRPAVMAQPLDWGAAGIHLPQVTSAEMARCAVHATKFHPLGERGLQPYVRAASYRAYPTADYLATANDETLLVAQVEGVEGIAHLESILGVKGVDVAFVGPYDLSQSLGIPGQVKHARVKEAVAGAVRLAATTGNAIGTYCDDAESALEYKELGVSYLTVSNDAAIFLSGARSLVAKLRA